MKEHNTYNNENPEVIENYKEEGVLTLEALDIASHDATTTAHKKHIEHMDKSFKLTTPVAIIIAAVIISGGLIGYGAITQGTNSNTKATMFTGKAIDKTDYIDGKVDSKVIVVEYSDPECPYCISVYPTLKQIRTKYTDKIAFVYRHFPLTDRHPHAFDESHAIICAGKVGGATKYFEYMDALFGYKVPKQSQSNPSPQLPLSGKENIAKEIGLDMLAFNSCMKKDNTEKDIKDLLSDSAAAGVQGTPSTFVLIKTRKGYEVVSVIDGAQSIGYFEAAIEEALNR